MNFYKDPTPTSFVTVGNTGSYQPQLQRPINNFHLQEIETLQNSLREREEYVTQLENRLRALWEKYDGDRKHYMDRIKRLVMAGDALLGSSHCIDYHEKVVEWNKAKKDKP